MRSRLGFTLLLSLFPLAAASGEPLDLQDPTPRAVAVAFESSPSERPGALDVVYGEPLRAWLEPADVAGLVRVRIPGPTVERRLFEGFDPLPGSFTDYVWTFDATTGDVIAATLHGRLKRPVPLGLVTHVETAIDVRVGTLRSIGFLAPRVRLGQILFHACQPATPDCTTVAPSPLDPRTGYVNAVGTIRARALGAIEAETFSPIGEAIFSEMPADLALELASED